MTNANNNFNVDNLDAFIHFDDDAGRLPLTNVTAVSDEQLRNAHNYWTNCHNFSTAQVATIQVLIKDNKRKRDVRFKHLYLTNKDKGMNNEVSRYAAESEDIMVEYDNNISELEQYEIQWLSLQKQCDYLKAFCSREQSYRENEMKTYFGRGGQGR